MTPDPTLRCPACQFTAPLSEFVALRYGSWFTDRAFPLLMIIVVLAVLRGLGVLK